MRSKCPACSASSIPLYQRLGWHRFHPNPVTCRACGGRFEFPWWARLAMLALLLLSIPLALVLGDALSERIGSVPGLVLGFAAVMAACFVLVTTLFAAAPLRQLRE